MRFRLTTLIALAVAGCSGSKSQDPPTPLKVRASALEIPADGITTATVTISNSTAGNIVVSTSLGVLETDDGQSGKRVTLAQDGAATLRSACDANVEDGCWGWAWVSASDAVSPGGSTRVHLSCSGDACRAEARAGGRTIGSNLSGGPCGGNIETECNEATSGFHVSESLGRGETIVSGSDVTRSLDSASAVAFRYAPDGGTQDSVRFSASSGLEAGSYTDDGSGDPGLTTVLGCSSSPAVGSFEIRKLTRSSDQLTEFTATFDEHCQDDTSLYVCGCIHWVR